MSYTANRSKAGDRQAVLALLESARNLQRHMLQQRHAVQQVIDRAEEVDPDGCSGRDPLCGIDAIASQLEWALRVTF